MDWLSLYVISFVITASWGHWTLLWPGTVVHELLHWCLGGLLNAGPTRISLFPRGETLGEVEFRNLSSWKVFPVALAPLLAIPLLLLAWPWLQQQQGISQIFWAWTAASVSVMSLPSRQDLALIAQAPVASTVWTLAITALLYASLP